MATLDLRGASTTIYGTAGADMSVSITFTDSAGDPVDVSGYTAAADVLRGSTVVDSFATAVSGAGSNVLTLTLTDAETLAIGSERRLRWRLSMTAGGVTEQWISGGFELSPFGEPAASNTSSLSVQVSGAISATVQTPLPLATLDGRYAPLGSELGNVRQVFNVKRYGAVGNGVTDDADAVSAAITAADNAGGGVVYFPTGVYLISTQIVLPNTTNTGVGSEAQDQNTFVFVGDGALYSGQNEVRNSATTLLMTYNGDGSGGDAKLVTYGLGLLEATGITFKDTTANADTPFIYTTNTTLHIHNCAFVGATSGTSCQQDGIVCGGTTKPVTDGYDDPDSAFQGYGTVIRENYFNRIRRCVWGRSYFNQAQIVFNMFDKGCGTNLVGGACVEIDGSLDLGAGTSDYCTSNVIMGNYFHYVGGYYYQVRLKKATRCVVAFNGFVDPGDNGVAGVRCEHTTVDTTVYPALDNMIIGNAGTNVTQHLSEDAESAGRNTLLGGGSGDDHEFALSRDAQLYMPGASDIVVETPEPGVANWSITDLVTEFLKLDFAANGRWQMGGPLVIKGNNVGGSAAGTTRLNIGNNSISDDAVLTFDTPTGKQGQIQFKRAGSNSWLFYDANSTSFFFRDSVNGVMHLTLAPGSASTGRVDLGVKLRAVAAQGIEMGSGGPKWLAGSGTPEGAISAPVGSMYSRTDGGAGTSFYVKESGTGNTGWVAK